MPSACKHAENSGKTPRRQIFKKLADQRMLSRFFKNKRCSGLLRRCLRFDKHSEYSSNFERIKNWGPETAAKWHPRAGFRNFGWHATARPIYISRVHSLAVSQTRVNSCVTGHGRERAHFDSLNEVVCDTYLAHIVNEMLRIAVGHVNADLVHGCLADLERGEI